MQDNEKIYRIELTNEEYEFLENLKNEFCNKLSKMTEEEITEYLKSFYPEQDLNFEKEINGTVYKVKPILIIFGTHYITDFLKSSKSNIKY
ncbi:MAG: hypothetical protein ACLR6T_04755 [Intestinibacter sp.]